MMFKAIVLACLISDPSQCVEFWDTRGPTWPDRESCKRRCMEMARSVGEIDNGLVATAWRCEPLREGRLTQWIPSP